MNDPKFDQIALRVALEAGLGQTLPQRTRLIDFARRLRAAWDQTDMVDSSMMQAGRDEWLTVQDQTGSMAIETKCIRIYHAMREARPK
jgi:hypothetical protein